MRYAALICACVLFFTSKFVAADERHVATRLLCDEDHAILQVARAYNKPPVFAELPATFAGKFSDAKVAPDFECDLGRANRPRPLRIKIGTIPGVHFGACGGATKHFFSLWVDKRKILSKRMLDNPCTHFDNLEFVYFGGSTLVFCATPKAAPTEPFALLPRDKRELTCIDVSHIYRDALRTPVDEIEYPRNGVPRREGHVILLHSENAELCTYLLAQFQAGQNFYNVFDQYRREAGSSPIDQHSWGVQAATAPFKVDINNDGRDDLLAIREYGMGSVGQELVILADGREADRHQRILEEFDRKRPYELPALIPVKKTSFGTGLRPSVKPYTLLRAFEWHGTNYVLIASVYDIRPPEWVVALVSPDNSFSEVCVLDRVPIHY